MEIRAQADAPNQPAVRCHFGERARPGREHQVVARDRVAHQLARVKLGEVERAGDPRERHAQRGFGRERPAIERPSEHGEVPMYRPRPRRLAGEQERAGGGLVGHAFDLAAPPGAGAGNAERDRFAVASLGAGVENAVAGGEHDAVAGQRDRLEVAAHGRRTQAEPLHDAARRAVELEDLGALVGVGKEPAVRRDGQAADLVERAGKLRAGGGRAEVVLFEERGGAAPILGGERPGDRKEKPQFERQPRRAHRTARTRESPAAAGASEADRFAVHHSRASA
jgi:hypothetical protein